MKKLPIKMDSYVMTECWTFYKLAIIQTHPNYLEWLAGHMSLVMFDNYECFFGDKYGIFPIEYFNDILQYEEINISSFASDNIVDVIKKEIDNGNYVMFDCNYNAFEEKPEIDDRDIHEALLYGYDDEKQIMFTSILSDNKFIEAEFPYELVLRGYEWSLRFFNKYPKEIYYRRGWTYPVSRIKLKNDLYCFDPIFSLIHKLENEFMGGRCARTYLNDEGIEEKRTYYYGNDIIGTIADLCIDAMERDISLFNVNSGKVLKVLVKLYEHEKMILDSVKWAYEKMNINTEASSKLYKQYFDIADSLQRLYLLCIKYKMKPSERTLILFAKKTKECLIKRGKVLKRIKNFCKMNMQDMPQLSLYSRNVYNFILDSGFYHI